MDVSILKKRIFELRNEFNPANPMVEDNLVGQNYEIFRDIITKCAFLSFYGNADVWKKAGLRVESQQDFMNCLEKLKKTEIGRGVFGAVYRVHANKCIHNIPSNVKQIAVKVELLRPNTMFGFAPKTPETIKETFEISKRMGVAGIGPKVYDRFITILNDGIRIVSVYEFIDGVTFKDMKWKKPEHKQKAIVSIQELVHKMNKLGVQHSDLHSENIMIDKKGRILLIDFDFASLLENVEQNRLRTLNYNNPVFTKIPTYVSEDAIIFYIHTLLKEGTIKM